MNDFEKLRGEMESYDEAREKIIKESREILKASKQAIYALHRSDLKEAQALLKTAADVKKRLEQEMREDPTLRTGGFSGACEEYVEALSFLRFLEKGDLLPYGDAGVQAEEYLGGLADLTGELGRRAVILATARDKKGVEKIVVFTNTVYGEFVKFDFRNGELRKKYDSIKYNLQKMENVLYDLTLKGRAQEE